MQERVEELVQILGDDVVLVPARMRERNGWAQESTQAGKQQVSTKCLQSAEAGLSHIQGGSCTSNLSKQSKLKH